MQDATQLHSRGKICPAHAELAEFIIASAMNIDLSIPREEWGAWDLTSPEGILIEVKSAAYLHSWTRKDYLRIAFSIRAARPWDAASGKFADQPRRMADVYVFCLLKNQDKDTLDPLDLEQWEFYVLPTGTIEEYERSDSSITLNSLRELCDPIPYNQLRENILDAYSRNRPACPPVLQPPQE
jgi:hypothetical protein